VGGVPPCTVPVPASIQHITAPTLDGRSALIVLAVLMPIIEINQLVR
jgi:hypothetical protein